MWEQQLVNGLVSGGVYALFALGLTLVFGVLDILNLAHASVFMLAAFTALLVVDQGIPFPIAIVVATFVAGLLGILLERVAFRPIRDRADSNLSGLLTSIAASIILAAGALAFFGPDAYRYPRGSLPDHTFAFANVRLTALQLLTLVLSVVMMVGLKLLLDRTSFGRSIRAIAEKPLAARVVGVNINQTIAGTFFLSGALGGLAGVLYGLLFNTMTADMGDTILLKGLAVIILGGMASVTGAAVAGFVLGLVEVFTVQSIGSEWRDAVAFGVIFVILVVRPTGLFGLRRVREI